MKVLSLYELWCKVDLSNPEGCWPFLGHINKDGYGQLSRYSKMYQAHRVYYEICTGVDVGSLTLDHLCKNRACVNPLHLEPVTLRENQKRATLGKFYRDKTHCPKGHPYDDENTYRYKNGRHCKTCRRERQRRKL
jgi:hypothetical protein